MKDYGDGMNCVNGYSSRMPVAPLALPIVDEESNYSPGPAWWRNHF